MMQLWLLSTSEARCIVFPPYLEYGLIPLEANACGTPVIATERAESQRQ